MGDMLKGDPKSPSAKDSMLGVLQALQANYAPLSQQIQGQMTPYAQAELASQQATAPGVAQLNADIYKQFSPQYAQTASQTERDLINGTGGETVRAADVLNRQIDPEYYKTREASSGKLGELLAGMDPNKLTEQESANVERGLNRTNLANGTSNTPNSGTKAISAALTFGDALNSKRNAVAGAINSATQALPTFKGGTDAFSQATGRSGTQAFGQNFAGNPSQAGLQAGNAAVGLTGNLQQQSNDINANRRTIMDYVGQAWQQSGLGGAVSGGGGGCCFILLEALNGELPWFVRIARNYYYEKNPEIAVGYKRMANWLVPLMQRYAIIKSIVNTIMIKPIISYGGYICGVEPYKKSFAAKQLKNFWFNIWRITGQDNRKGAI